MWLAVLVMRWLVKAAVGVVETRRRSVARSVEDIMTCNDRWRRRDNRAALEQWSRNRPMMLLMNGVEYYLWPCYGLACESLWCITCHHWRGTRNMQVAFSMICLIFEIWIHLKKDFLKRANGECNDCGEEGKKNTDDSSSVMSHRRPTDRRAKPLEWASARGKMD